MRKRRRQAKRVTDAIGEPRQHTPNPRIVPHSNELPDLMPIDAQMRSVQECCAAMGWLLDPWDEELARKAE